MHSPISKAVKVSHYLCDVWIRELTRIYRFLLSAYSNITVFQTNYRTRVACIQSCQPLDLLEPNLKEMGCSLADSASQLQMKIKFLYGITEMNTPSLT
jgi:hypothetical protein